MFWLIHENYEFFWIKDNKDVFRQSYLFVMPFMNQSKKVSALDVDVEV